MDDASLKMSKNGFCLCSCMRGLGLAYVSYIHAYVALFLRFCIRGNGPVYAGYCLCMWALTHVREMPDRSSTLPILTYFSSISLPRAILTHFFFFFFSFLHPTITISFFLSSFLHQNIIFSKFYLNQESNITFFFYTVIIPLCW